MYPVGTGEPLSLGRMPMELAVKPAGMRLGSWNSWMLRYGPTANGDGGAARAAGQDSSFQEFQTELMGCAASGIESIGSDSPTRNGKAL